MMLSKFDYYKNGGISNILPTEQITVKEAIEIIKSNKYKYEIELIRSLGKCNESDQIKRNLDYFTFSGTFTNRSNANLIEASGLICLDIDGLEKNELLEVKNKILPNKYTHFAFLSPSGNGFKIGIKIPIVKNDEEYKEYWNAVAFSYNLPRNVDKSAKDISRACFVSYDTNAYYNSDSEVFKGRIKLKPTTLNIDAKPKLVSELKDMIVSQWTSGQRQSLALYLCGALRSKGYGVAKIIAFLSEVMDEAGDTDKEQRLQAVKSTFEKDEADIKGFSGLKELFTPDDFMQLCKFLDQEIRKEKVTYKQFNVTNHIPQYDNLDDALGLKGNEYNPLKKAIWYSIIGNAIKNPNTYITYKGTQFDTRDSLAVFAMSNSGKGDIKRIMLKCVPSNNNNRSTTVVSLHAEQLIGKSKILRDKRTQQENVHHNYGYFNDDVLVFDEMRSLFMNVRGSQANTFTEWRKHFCLAADPMGNNLITKRSVDQERCDTLQYFPRCTMTFLTQPVNIASEVIESGFLRRLTLIEINSKTDVQTIYNARVRSHNKDIFVDDIVIYLDNLERDLRPEGWVFDNIEDDLVKYSMFLYDYGVSHSEKSAAFITQVYTQSLFDKLLKYSCIVAAYTKHNKVVTGREVRIAYMDLFEILTSTFECLDKYSESFYKQDMSYNNLLILRWLKMRRAISSHKSSTTLSELKDEISNLYQCQYRTSETHYSKLMSGGYIKVKYGKHNAIVYLTQKSLDLLKDSYGEVSEKFYEEYLKICDEVKFNVNR